MNVKPHLERIDDFDHVCLQSRARICLRFLPPLDQDRFLNCLWSGVEQSIITNSNVPIQHEQRDDDDE